MGGLKSRDVPPELRTWWKSFERASYRHDYSRVFDDFVTMTLTQFIPPGTCEDWHKEAMRAYNTEEKQAFNEMFFEIFKVFQEQVGTPEVPGKVEYYDVFGTMYEAISSAGKKQKLGQFFTPSALIEVLSGIQLAEISVDTVDKLEEMKKKRFYDPACGSGRMLFIAHVRAPGNYQYGVDIDPLCAKMACVNMMLHGCIGEVVCGNALILESDWRWAFSINPILHRTGVPSLMRIEKDTSFIWHQNQTMLEELRNPPKPTPPPEPEKSKVEEEQDFLNNLRRQQIKAK